MAGVHCWHDAMCHALPCSARVSEMDAIDDLQHVLTLRHHVGASAAPSARSAAGHGEAEASAAASGLERGEGGGPHH